MCVALRQLQREVSYFTSNAIVKSTEPDVPHVQDFNEYFDSTWMNGQYPIKMWDFFKYDGPRTNNHIEGYHTRLMRKVGKIHPQYL